MPRLLAAGSAAATFDYYLFFLVLSFLFIDFIDSYFFQN